MNDFDIERGFTSQNDIEKILSKFKADILVERDTEGNNKDRDKIFKQMIFVKFDTIFKRQIQLDKNEAIAFYNSHIDILKERIDILYNIIETINCEMALAFVPNKLLICHFFRVSAETFSILLDDAQVLPEQQNLFREVNEYILSLSLAGLENGVSNNYSWKRLTLEGKFGGNEVREKLSENNKSATILIQTDLKRKLSTEYNFQDLIDTAEAKETK